MFFLNGAKVVQVESNTKKCSLFFIAERSLPNVRRNL